MKTARFIIAEWAAVVNDFLQKRWAKAVRASNIGNTEPSENSQGKGGDLRSKYYPTLTVVRKAYWALAVRRNAPDGLVCYRSP